MTGQAGPVLVGYGPEDRGRGGLELARLIAESAGRALLVTCVIPDRWGSVGPGRSVDQDYQDHLHGLARQALAHARDALAECAAPVDYRVITARSAAAGLSQAAQEAQAWLLVAGSSADGAWGHIALGSTSDRMLHSARVPVALASRGQRYPQGGRVARVTAAVDGSDSSATVLAAAAVFSDQLGVPLRVVSFAVRAGTMYPPEVGLHAEDRVVAAWRAQAQEMLAGSSRNCRRGRRDRRPDASRSCTSARAGRGPTRWRNRAGSPANCSSSDPAPASPGWRGCSSAPPRPASCATPPSPWW